MAGGEGGQRRGGEGTREFSVHTNSRTADAGLLRKCSLEVEEVVSTW